MKFIFICNDSLIISPLFASYFNYLCEVNVLKIRVDFCGIKINEESQLEEEVIEKIKKYYQTNNIVNDLSPKLMTPDLLETANFVFVSSDDVKKKVLATKIIPEEVIFSMTRRKRKLETFTAKNNKKFCKFTSIVEKEMFFLIEKIIRHQYIL